MSTLPEPPSLPEQIFSLFREVLLSLLNSTEGLIERNGQNLLMGILTLIIGWFLASLLRGLTSKLLRAIGVDVIADRTRLRRFLQKNDIQRPPSQYLGWGVYLLILYGTTLAVFHRLGLDMLAEFLLRIGSTIPRVFVVFLLLGLGFGVGKLASKFIARAARVAGLPVPQVLGSAVRFAVILFSFFLSLNYLEWASPSVLLAGFALVLGLALGTAILFAIAARPLTESLLNHPFIKATYLPGDTIRCSLCEGTVVKVDAAATFIRSEEGLMVIPNRQLAAQTVRVRRSSSSLPK